MESSVFCRVFFSNHQIVLSGKTGIYIGISLTILSYILLDVHLFICEDLFISQLMYSSLSEYIINVFKRKSLLVYIYINRCSKVD